MTIYNFAVNAKYNLNSLSFNEADEYLKVQKAKEFEKCSFWPRYSILLRYLFTNYRQCFPHVIKEL